MDADRSGLSVHDCLGAIHLLAPGTTAVIDVAFDRVVDAPGVHGEVIHVVTDPET